MSFWKPWSAIARKQNRRTSSSTYRARFERLEPRALLTSVAGDFNGDGLADLAIGIPGKNIGAAVDGGAVSVLYGSNANGLSSTQNQVWNLNRPGVRGNAQANDAFGSSLAVGDFNGDGYSDLAIGMPGRKVNGKKAAGAVTVLYGSANGLSSAGNDLWLQTNIGFNFKLKQNARFGAALTTGDFNGDGYSDLAIGSPFQQIGRANNIGVTFVLYGDADGLDTVGRQRFSQRRLVGTPDPNDQFGAALTSGDFNADGYEDLAVGVPGDSNGAGGVNVIYGRPKRLRPVNNQLFGPASGIRVSGRYGQSVASGDFNADGYADLAAGAPGNFLSSGAVNVLYGSGSRLMLTGNQIWTAGDLGGTSTRGDQFGFALAVGDFDNDIYDDLAIGVPYATANDLAASGQVYIAQGSGGGLSGTGAQILAENTIGLNNGAAGDHFGWSLTVGDFNGDDYDDIAVGIPNKRVGSIEDAGQVQSFYGSLSGITRSGNQSWRQGVGGLLGTAQEGDGFGTAVA